MATEHVEFECVNDYLQGLVSKTNIDNTEAGVNLKTLITGLGATYDQYLLDTAIFPVSPGIEVTHDTETASGCTRIMAMLSLPARTLKPRDFIKVEIHLAHYPTLHENEGMTELTSLYQVLHTSDMMLDVYTPVKVWLKELPEPPRLIGVNCMQTRVVAFFDYKGSPFSITFYPKAAQLYTKVFCVTH